jgi:hypothetical protein
MVCDPIKPVPPVTRIFIGKFFIAAKKKKIAQGVLGDRKLF